MGSIRYASRPCYYVNGTLAPSSFQPCNPNTAVGMYSACCNLTATPPDFCLSSGLCFSQISSSSNGLIYAYGCTDATGNDGSCQQYCRGKRKSQDVPRNSRPMSNRCTRLLD